MPASPCGPMRKSMGTHAHTFKYIQTFLYAHTHPRAHSRSESRAHAHARAIRDDRLRVGKQKSAREHTSINAHTHARPR
eukprot:5117009-Pleurochrysis_carterae.AAC.2